MTTILLAAGLSSRMGTNKLLLPYSSKTVLEATLDKALAVSDRVVVVVGHEKEKVEALLASYPVTFVYNENYQKGQVTSVKKGIEAVQDDDFAILPGDLPAITEEDMLHTFAALKEAKTARAVHDSIPGHPVAYQKENRERLLAYPGSMKEYLKEVGCRKVPASLGSVYDVDTKERYDALVRSNGDLSILNRDLNTTITTNCAGKNCL